ncbi:MAG TPA: ATP-binding protein [Candidatus Eisenbacteria bacterium]
MLATSALSFLSYRGVRGALQADFERRLSNAAAATASQIGPQDIADAHRLGEEGTGYANLQVQLEALRATTGLANASLFDSARIVVYDCRGAEFQREPTRLDSLAPASVARALAGRVVVTGPYVLSGSSFRAGLAPVPGRAGGVAGVVAVEGREDHLPVLARFRRALALTAIVIALAVAILAALRIRGGLAAERLERRLARAENLAAMGRLTATLAHEIRNPLAIIRGSAQRLGKLEPEAQRMAGFIVEETDRLSRTVARYLQFARAEVNADEAGDAAAALRATLDLLEGECRDRKVTVERRDLDAPAPVALDPESLKQVYLNLILNALEAMSEGGNLSLARAERGGRFEFTITDDGAGVAPDILKRLGDPFFTTKAKGSGLGLFLTRRLVQSAGGDLEIRPEPGRGTTCVVRLPRRKE